MAAFLISPEVAENADPAPDADEAVWEGEAGAASDERDGDGISSPAAAAAADAASAAASLSGAVLSARQRRQQDQDAKKKAALQQQQHSDADRDSVQSVANMRVGPNNTRLTSAKEVRAFFAQQLLDQGADYEQQLKELAEAHQQELDAKDEEIAQLHGYASGINDPAVATLRSHLTADFVLKKTPTDMAVRARKLATAIADIASHTALLEDTRRRLTLARFEKDILTPQVAEDQKFASIKKTADEARARAKGEKAKLYEASLAERKSTEDALQMGRVAVPEITLSKPPMKVAAAAAASAAGTDPYILRDRTSLKSPDGKSKAAAAAASEPSPVAKKSSRAGRQSLSGDQQTDRAADAEAVE